jgi:DNA polymerase-3 subunit alpha
MKRFEPHSHTEYSNIRLLDCINKPKNLIDRAIKLGLCGIAITDHECLSGSVKINKIAEEIRKDNPNFKVAIGNEIYLVEDRTPKQKYYHFILIAKNKTGFQALKELSSYSWMNSYSDRGLERVPTLYSELHAIVKKYPNSLIATTACLGGEVSSLTNELIAAEKIGDTNSAKALKQRICDFISFCINLFGEDFYIECAPGRSKEQVEVNKRLVSLANAFNVKMVIGTDAHFLSKEDRYVHKSYLNSKEGDREVDAFYEFSYLQTEDEIKENLSYSIIDEYEKMVQNSYEIYEKIENYSILHKQTIPKVEVKDYPRKSWITVNGKGEDNNKYPILSQMLKSEDKIERYWVNECINKMYELGILDGEDAEVYLARLEEEADIKRTIGEKLETNMFAYPVTLQHYVDLFWECGSMVGAGRGSSCSGLNHYLLGITQLDPIEWDLPFWRYLNKERTELGDIDLDLCPSKRPAILRRIKNERGRNFISEIDELSRRNLGCTLIATFGTEGTRSTILTACRGYRSDEYPDGIDTDTAQYLSSLIPSERGFLWELKDVLEGNEEKGRKPIMSFINEVSLYPGLIDIMKGIEGIVNKRSSHASGVILFDENPYEFGCFMKTPKGEIITQYDLHDAEAAGLTKYDFLVTEVQDKLVECINLLQEDDAIEKDLTLREIYNKYFHPNVLPLDDRNIWNKLHTNSVLNIFQFDSDVGSQAAKKIKPTNILEMADANGLMRLMTSEKGQETPMEKYVRYKNDISLWYDEMQREGLTDEEMRVLEPHFKRSYGVPPSQEQMMTMLMDKDICNFTLAEANNARKIVGKKQMSKIPELKALVLEKAKTPLLGKYVWTYGIGPQMGYSFSIIHALAYSFIGFQTMYIATKWNPIYWNCACLIVNSGALEETESEIVDIYETEDFENFTYKDLPDRKGKIKEKSTDYAKMAKALGDIISKGIKVSLVDINNSDYGFKPDVKNNQIRFGMKALSGISAETIEKIKNGRPYNSIKDFMKRCPLNKTQMISLIKAGSFDEIDKSWAASKEIRYSTMVYYLSIVSEPKKRLTLQNMNMLIEKNLLPPILTKEKNIFLLNKYLKKNKTQSYYCCPLEIYNNFMEELEEAEPIGGYMRINSSIWDNKYKNYMNPIRDYLKENGNSLLQALNETLFMEAWNKYAKGNISAWEMESMCFYYHEHELTHVNIEKYGFSNFNELPEIPEVDYFFKRNGREIPIWKTTKIIGTVISKNDNKSSVCLLTINGVVTVKFTREYYAMFNKQLSEIQEDGTKKVREKGWFSRGTKIMVTGYRRDDMFVAKTYKHTPTHQLYKILNVEDNGDIVLTHLRWRQEEN